MKYILEKASKDNIEYLIKCKLSSILEYTNELSKDEIINIKNYVNKTIPLQINNYKIIMINNRMAGCILVELKDNRILLDEIYIENDYRNKGIGTDIIRNVLLDNREVYLWVWKLNRKAVNLYKKLGFYILEETETRYYMKNDKNYKKLKECR